MKYDNIKTPCYILEEMGLKNSIAELRSAINNYWPNTIVGYSYKTNSLLWLIKKMKLEGFLAEVVSHDEYNLAKNIGYDSSKIIYNGPIKEKKSFFDILDNNGYLNIDSYQEVEWLISSKKEYSVGIRVNLALEDYLPEHVQNQIEGSRFGFSYENGDLQKVITKLKENNINVRGLHLHCSSKTRSLEVYEMLCEKFVEIIDKLDYQLDYIDIGGGFFNGVPNKPGFSDYFKVISSLLSKNEKTKNILLIVEPGISLIGSNMSYLVKVKDVKSNTKSDFIITDGTRLHIDPFFHKTTYFYDLECNSKNSSKQIISGYTCIENDRFMLINDLSLKIGDYIRFRRVGAYTLTFVSDFIQFSPFVYLENDYYKVIRKKRTYSDILVLQED